MRQEDEKSFTNEEADSLLPQPEESSERVLAHKSGLNSCGGLSLLIVAVVSVLLNILLCVLLLKMMRNEKTPYGQYLTIFCRYFLMKVVGMKFDTVGTISYTGPYGPSNQNETERAILWENVDGSSAQIAVDKSWAANKNLPPTQEFSWDKEKAVYSLRGYHGQHCLVRF